MTRKLMLSAGMIFAALTCLAQKQTMVMTLRDGTVIEGRGRIGDHKMSITNSVNGEKRIYSYKETKTLRSLTSIRKRRLTHTKL